MGNFTFEDIKNGLERCGRDTCAGCPYKEVNRCIDALMIDARDAISSLQAANEAFTNLVKELTEEKND